MPAESSAAGHRRSLCALAGHSPEWTAFVRRHPRSAAGCLALSALCTAVPYLGFAALAASALLCARIYARNEPLWLLQLPRAGAATLLARKIRTAWRNYFAPTLPLALVAAALHPRAAWMAALWLPLAALALVYAVLAKYARYDPRTPRPRPLAIDRAGLAGIVFPPLLPLTLWLTVRYALAAERNLDRYLHDYD